NLLQIPNTESNSHYLRTCKKLGREGHPARFPAGLPGFFIKFLTDRDDVVLDLFSGSNTTGRAAEELGRRWLTVEMDRSSAALSAVRFTEGWKEERVRSVVQDLEIGKFLTIDMESRQVSEAPAIGVQPPVESAMRMGQRFLFRE
ncbi:MAG: DNA methyltransferase, partial [Isosphaerales bacterium]